MLQLYKKIQRRGFQDEEHSLTFLSFVYGADSPIIQYHLDMRELRRANNGAQDPSKDLVTASQTASSILMPSQRSQRRIDSAHDNYWKVAERLLVHTKTW